MEIEQVVDVAKNFLSKSGYLTSRLMKIALDKSTKQWHLDFDIGALTTITVKVAIDDESGRIIGFERESG